MDEWKRKYISHFLSRTGNAVGEKYEANDSRHILKKLWLIQKISPSHWPVPHRECCGKLPGFAVTFYYILQRQERVKGVWEEDTDTSVQIYVVFYPSQSCRHIQQRLFFQYVQCRVQQRLCTGMYYIDGMLIMSYPCRMIIYRHTRTYGIYVQYTHRLFLAHLSASSLLDTYAM